MDVKVAILDDNIAGAPSFRAEHGLSVLLQVEGRSFLWDCGQSDIAVYNAQKLGLDLSRLEGIGISHGHYDHAGGLLNVLEVSGPKKVYFHPDALLPKYVKLGEVERGIGIPFSRSEIEGASLELELTRGQHLDMSFESRDGVTVEQYLDMIQGKTAALIAGSAHLGAFAAGADGPTQGHYRAFGHNLGMAFQALDDILDIWGDPTATGKKAAEDIHQRKKSLPVLYGLERSAALRELYACPDPFDDAAVEQAVALLDEVEARQYAEGLARHYSDQTLEHLQAASPQGEAAQALFELVESLLHRDR